MSAVAVIRPALPQDQGGVGRVAYRTGFLGQSAARYFPDEALFAALWVGPYFQGAGAGGFVAELDGEVVGYILGAPDHRAYRQALTDVVARHLRATRPTLATLRSVPYLLRAARYPTRPADWTAYPAHLHLNLLPGARGLGAGRRLLDAHLAVLGGLGVPGVQLSTTTENVAALTLYRRAGFGELSSQVSRLWRPWLGRATTHLVMGLRCPGRGADPEGRG